jgi:preprotein translocase subunit SecD
MQKNIGIKIIVILAILLVFTSLIFLGNDSSRSLAAIKERGLLAGLQESIHLGLDLQGGAHFIYQVKVNEAVSAQAGHAVETLKEEFQKTHTAFTDISTPDPDNQPDRIVIKGLAPDALTQLRDLVAAMPEYDAPALGPDNTYILTMKTSSLIDIKTRTLAQSIDAITNRIDTLGVREPTIQPHGLGEYQILIQLPGADDTARIRIIIQSTARLEVRQAFGSAQGFSSEQAALEAFPGKILPLNTVFLHGRDVNARSGDQERVYIVAKVPVVGGTDLRSAEPGRDEANRPDVIFNLTRDAGEKFAAFTRAHNEQNGTPDPYLAIILDNRVREAASIKEEIGGGQVRITGGFTEQSANDLVTLLNSGSLPASLVPLEERTVGPSLGSDSIKHGIQAAVVGMVVVMVFMLFYYKFAGINADLALILNLVILLGFLGLSGATLTLPGIAGVILTVGMGVDSNVLIFERIREELRNGKAPAAAVDQGFGRAWVTIIDTHVTTIVSAVILFLFGTGPVKGFAVTLTFGLLANLFTAVFVSRVIFDAILSRKERGAALSI